MPKFTESEILNAIASGGPKEGEKWTPEKVARALADFVNQEVEDEKRIRAAWDQGNKDWEVRYVTSDAPMGSVASITAWQAESIAKHSAFVQQRIQRNRALIERIGGAVVSLASAHFTGGLTTPVLVAGLLGIGRQISGALNDQGA